MSKIITVRANLFDKDPNEIRYKGRRGMNVSVHRGGAVDEVFEWETKSFDMNDRLNSLIFRERMSSMISAGWQKVDDAQIGHWKLVEKNGLRFADNGCTIKILSKADVKPVKGKLSLR